MSTLNNIKNYSKNEINGQIFKEKYYAFAAVLYWNNKNNDKLESTDKIVLPPSTLSKLTSRKILNSLNKNPIIFEIANVSEILPKKSHCSVIEFTANDGCAYLPLQIMNNLGLDYNGNDIIELTTVNLPKGKLVQVQAHKTEKVLSLSSIPKYVFEKHLTKYAVLTVGDSIQVEYKHNIYKFDITKVKPSIIQSTAPPAINIIECDIEVDFKEPRDYKQWKQLQIINDINSSTSSEFYCNINDIDDHEEKKDESESSFDYSNGDDDSFDPPESPDYFDYGQRLLSTPKSSKSSQQSKTVFSFQDANKGFSFCKHTKNEETNSSK